MDYIGDIKNISGEIYLRRKDAGAYLRGKYGFCSANFLAKLAVSGGGPVMTYAGSMPLYKPSDLDAWAMSKMTSPPVRSTTERDAQLRNGAHRAEKAA